MAKRRKKVELFRSRNGEWRYRAKGGNGQIIDQSEGYTRKHDAKRAAERNHGDKVLVICE